MTAKEEEQMTTPTLKDRRFIYCPTADAAYQVIMAHMQQDGIVAVHRNMRIPRWHQFGQWRAVQA